MNRVHHDISMFSLYQQYCEYKYYSRKPQGNFKSFIEQYEQLRREVDENIFSRCSRLQIQIIDLLAVSNLAPDDVEDILESLKGLTALENYYEYVKVSIEDISDALDGLEEGKLNAEESQDSKLNLGEIKENNLKDFQDSKLEVAAANNPVDNSIKDKQNQEVAENVVNESLNKCADEFKQKVETEVDAKKSQNDHLPNKYEVAIPIPAIQKCVKKKRQKGKGDPSRGSKYKIRRLKDGKYVYYCNLCDKDFSDDCNALRMHKENHNDTKKPCPICGKMFSVRHHNLWRHIRDHKHRDSGEYIRCNQLLDDKTVCDYKTKIKSCLRQHFNKIHAPKEFSCDICGKQFQTQHRLEIHIKSYHSTKLTCPYCPFSTHKEGLDKHILRRHNRSASSICTFCSFETSDDKILQEHMVSEHPKRNDLPKKLRKKKEYNCGQCDFKGNLKQSLRAHKMSVHEGIRYNCDYDGCQFTATQSVKLREHVKVRHLGVRRSCDFCEFQTALRGTLTNHKLAKHPEFKIYSCHLCNYRTEHKDLLQRHLTGKYGKHGKNPN